MRSGAWKRFFRHTSAVLGLVVVLLYTLTALLAPRIAPHDPQQGRLLLRLKPPAWESRGDSAYPLGTDEQGRDMFSRVVYGARVSLAVGVGSVLAGAVIGGSLGLLAGFHGRWLDDVLSRLADWTLAFPSLILAILLMGMLGPGIFNLILVLTFTHWVHFFRLIRGETLAERRKPYVEAATAIGKSPVWIMFGDIARNVIHSLIVMATIRMGLAILMESSLSFLGFGVSPGIPAWGSMIASGKNYVGIAWWVPTVPGVAILGLVLSVNLLGEGLRDAFDPRLRSL